VSDALFEFHEQHAILSVVVAIIGYALWRMIGKDSLRRRLHGKYVLFWTVGGFVSGGVIAPYVMKGDLPNGAMGGCWFLMLAGWLLGMIHGAIALMWANDKGS